MIAQGHFPNVYVSHECLSIDAKKQTREKASTKLYYSRRVLVWPMSCEMVVSLSCILIHCLNCAQTHTITRTHIHKNTRNRKQWNQRQQQKQQQNNNNNNKKNNGRPRKGESMQFEMNLKRFFVCVRRMKRGRKKQWYWKTEKQVYHRI